MLFALLVMAIVARIFYNKGYTFEKMLPILLIAGIVAFFIPVGALIAMPFKIIGSVLGGLGGVLGGVFGVIGGVIGAVFGVIGAVIGLIFGAIGLAIGIITTVLVPLFIIFVVVKLVRKSN